LGHFSAHWKLEGAGSQGSLYLIAKNPLLIQKTVADKLSDKIQVIIAPPQAGGFFASGLVGPLGGGGGAKATPASLPQPGQGE